MRITSAIILEHLFQSLRANRETLLDLHARLASTKKINAVSDDVIAFMRTMDYRVSIGDNTQYTRNADEAAAQLEFADTALTAVNEIMLRLKELGYAGASGSLGLDIRNALAGEAAQLRDNLLTLGNSKFRDRYIFAGFLSGAPAFNAATYAYQGDRGIINVPIDRGAVMAVNVPGSDAFAYTLAAPQVETISGGRFAHYTPGSGTTITVEIRDTDNVTVLDTFSFSNIIQISDALSAAFASGNQLRIEALLPAIDRARDQAIEVQSLVGTRLAQLTRQTDQLAGSTQSLQALLSRTEDADIAETITSLTRAESRLKALMQASARILSPSLLDFLR